MKYRKTTARKSFNEDLLIIDQTLEKWYSKFSEKKERRKYIDEKDDHIMLFVYDLRMWVQDLRQLENETYPPIPVEDAAESFKKEGDDL